MLMVTYFSFCNRCYTDLEKHKIDEVRQGKRGSQTPIFRCTRCRSSCTKYVFDSRYLLKIIKSFIICKHCDHIWNTQVYGVLKHKYIQCPKCKKKFMLSDGIYKLHYMLSKKPNEVLSKIQERFPLLTRPRIEFILKDQWNW